MYFFVEFFLYELTKSLCFQIWRLYSSFGSLEFYPIVKVKKIRWLQFFNISQKDRKLNLLSNSNWFLSTSSDVWIVMCQFKMVKFQATFTIYISYNSQNSTKNIWHSWRFLFLKRRFSFSERKFRSRFVQNREPNKISLMAAFNQS